MKIEEKICAIREYLTEKYGCVEPRWESIIDQMSDNLQMIEKCKAEIEKHGIFDSESFKKNPLIATIKDLQAQVLKTAQQLGITPWSESKMKTTDNNDEALLKSIMGE